MGALKHSRQRDSIRAQMEGRTDHPTADTVYEEIKQIYPSISLGTVYRNLSLLADIGEIRKLSGLGGADRFDPRIDSHCHFVCSRCGCVLDVDAEGLSLQQVLSKAADDFSDGEVQSWTAVLRGVCKNCLGKN